MTANTSHSKPQLARPGAGLPLFETLVSRFYVLPRFWKKTSWEDAQKLFDHEGQRILTLTAGLTPEKLTTPVLITRIRGIEDSSRFWSVAMTMEHLMIVGRAMARGIVSLGRGEEPRVATDVALVKPKGAVQAEMVVKEFESFLKEFQKQMSNDVVDRNSKTRLKHAWFGRLNAREWHGLAGLHQNIHRKQIQAILRLL